MAVYTVKASGGDYTTIASAVAAADVSSDTWEIEIHDKGSAYDEAVSLSSITGTPTASNYVWIYSAAADKHDGTAGSGTRWVNTADSIAFTLSGVDYTRISDMELANGRSTANANKTVSFTGGTKNVLFDNCVIWSKNSSTDMVYCAAATAEVSVSFSNCVMYSITDKARTVIGLFQNTASAGKRTVNVDHCTIDIGDGAASATAVGGAIKIFNTSSTTNAAYTLNVYNTAFFQDGASATGYAINAQRSAGTVTINGSHNGSQLASPIATDGTVTDNTTNWTQWGNGITATTTTADALIVANVTNDSEDFRLVRATGAGANDAIGNGTNRQGSEADSRSSLATDIGGYARPTTGVNIGAFAAGSDQTVTVKSSGGDYTTIASAVSAADASVGNWQIEIHDKGSAYSENVTLSSVTGTPTSSNYVWIYAAAADKHDGTEGSGVEWACSGNSNTFDLSVSYTRVSDLEITNIKANNKYPILIPNNSGANVTGLLFERLIIHDCGYDGISVPSSQSGDVELTASNCVIYDNGRAGIAGFTHTASAGDRTLNVEHCTLESTAGTYGGGVALSQNSSTDAANVCTANVYSTATFGSGAGIMARQNGSSTMTLNGSGNGHIASAFVTTAGTPTNNTTSNTRYANGVTTTTTTADALIVTNTTAGSEDYRLVRATGAGANDAIGNGTDRQGSEADSRSSLATDIGGYARPTTGVNIGAFAAGSDQTVSIIAAGGGDYTTIGTAKSDTDVSVGKWIMEIQDSSTYAESVSFGIASVVGTPTIDAYSWLTVNAANRHSGVQATSGHARINATGNGMDINQGYMRVSWLQIDNTSTAINYSGSSADLALIENCIFASQSTRVFTTTDSSSQDQTATFSNCVVAQQTSGIAFRLNQSSTTANSSTHTLNLDHCSIYQSGGGDDIVNVTHAGATGATSVLNVYNTASRADSGAYFLVFNAGTSSTCTVNGSHNLFNQATRINGSVTDNTTNWQTATGDFTDTTTTASAWIVADNVSNSSRDLTLVAATGAGSNLAIDNGTNRQGSEPDSRQDFSVTITGDSRPTTNVDIGAFELAVGVAQNIDAQVIPSVTWLLDGNGDPVLDGNGDPIIDDATAQVFTPTVQVTAAGSQNIDAAFISSTTTLYTPTVSTPAPVQNIDAAFIASTTTLYTPTVDPGGLSQNIDAAFISSTTTLYTPTVDPGGAPQNIDAAFISSTTTLYTPTVYTPGPVQNIEAAFVSSTLVIYSPTVTAADWYYLPPTVDIRPRVRDHARPGFLSYDVVGSFPEGVSILKVGGVWTQVRGPSVADLEAADAYYLGGHRHLVTSEVKAELEAAGVGGTFEAG